MDDILREDSPVRTEYRASDGIESPYRSNVRGGEITNLKLNENIKV